MGTLMARPKKPDALRIALDNEIVELMKKVSELNDEAEQHLATVQSLTAVRDRLYPAKKADT